VRTWYAATYRAARAAAAEHFTPTSNRGQAHPARLWAQRRGIPVAPTGRISPAVLSQWRTAGSPVPAATPRPSRVDPATAGETAAAQAYRALRAILATAVLDELLPANPCQIRGAGQITTKDRTPATPDQVAQIAAAMPERYAAAVTLAAWSGLRYGELFALARRHVDLEAGTLRVERALEQVPGQPIRFGKPKTAKSRRIVHLPRFVAEHLSEHMTAHVADDLEALLFPLRNGDPTPSAHLHRHFSTARAAAGRDDLRWHDLRHTGATLAYTAGASVPEVQARLGHSTMRAATIYAHTLSDSDRILAERLDAKYAPPA
jgi:integrase